MRALRDSRGRSVTSEDYRREVLTLVASALDEELADGRQSTAVAELRSDELAARLISVLPVVDPDNRLADLVGPCYSTAGVQTLLGRSRRRPVSKQAVEARRANRRILALRTSDGFWVYPTFQFGDDGDVRRDVIAVLTLFGPDSPSWSVAAWFRTPAASLDGRTPLDGLDRREQVREVGGMAADTAARWAS